MPASSRRVALGRGFEALRLLAVVTLTTGCPLIIPVPGKVDAGHSGSAAAALGRDDGLVIVVARGTGNRELEEHVISCAREAMERMPLAPGIVAADTSLRNAFHSLQEGENARHELAADPSFQEHITTLNLRYGLLVSRERGQGSQRMGDGVGRWSGHHDWAEGLVCPERGSLGSDQRPGRRIDLGSERGRFVRNLDGSGPGDLGTTMDP